MSKCKYILDNEGNVNFDELEDCPRYLSRQEQCILLDALGVSLVDFGSNLQQFALNVSDTVPIHDFFDMYYKDLYCSFRHMERAVNSYFPVTFTQFMGKRY